MCDDHGCLCWEPEDFEEHYKDCEPCRIEAQEDDTND